MCENNRAYDLATSTSASALLGEKGIPGSVFKDFSNALS